jgi:predicted TIM-barrel fold metal-dependent hydrolase
LAKRLDTYANFAVDVAASVQSLAQLETETVHQFLVKYQDRILYGSDVGVLNEKARDKESWERLNATHEREWSYFASSGVVTVEDPGAFAPAREVQGLGLSQYVLRKIFHDNPNQWLPGIVG